MNGSRDHTTESSERIQSKSADLIKWQKWPTDDSTVMPPWKRENPDNLRSCPVACSISLKMEDGILYCFPPNHYINRRREEFLLTIIPNNPFTIFLFWSKETWIQLSWQSSYPRETPMPRAVVPLNWKMRLPVGHSELILYWTDTQMKGLISKLWWFILITERKLGYYYTK